MSSRLDPFSGNPMLTAEKLTEDRVGPEGRRMTLFGTAVRTLVLVGILTASGAYTWNEFYKAVGNFDFSTLKRVPVEAERSPESSKKKAPTKLVVETRNPETGQVTYSPVPEFDLSKVTSLMWIGILGGLAIGVICILNPRSSPFLAPMYAALEGLAVGGVSAIYEMQFQGIVMQAVGITLAVFVVMLATYVMGAVRATPNFILFVTSAVGGIALLYIGDLVATSVFDYKIGIIHSNGPLGIGFSLFACAMAAVCFIVDFDEIEKAVEQGAPQYMEWYSAFGLLLTLVWLYLEILRLLAKLQSKKDD